MEQPRYQPYKHRRISSVQKSKLKQPESTHLPSHVKSANYTSNITKKYPSQNDEVETVESYRPNVSCKSGCVFDLDK